MVFPVVNVNVRNVSRRLVTAAVAVPVKCVLYLLCIIVRRFYNVYLGTVPAAVCLVGHAVSHQPESRPVTGDIVDCAAYLKVTVSLLELAAASYRSAQESVGFLVVGHSDNEISFSVKIGHTVVPVVVQILSFLLGASFPFGLVKGIAVKIVFKGKRKSLAVDNDCFVTVRISLSGFLCRNSYPAHSFQSSTLYPDGDIRSTRFKRGNYSALFYRRNSFVR